MNAADGLTFRRALDGDRMALERFANEIWPDAAPGLLERRWWWLTEPKQCFIACEPSGDIAAMVGERQARIAVGSAVVPATNVCDWYVSARYAGRGVGRALVANLMDLYELLLTISISDDAAVAFERLGWQRARTISMSLAPLPAAARAAAVLRARGGARNGLTVEDEEVSARSTPLPDLDQLWLRARPSDSTLMVRDASELRWRLSVVPSRRYRLVTCYERGVLAGYMLSRILPRGAIRQLAGVPAGLIVDFLSDRPESGVFDVLLARTMRYLAAERVGVVLTLATERSARRSLAASGFLSAGSPVIGRALGRLHTRFSAVFRNGTVPQNWYFTLADSDLDFTLGARLDP